MASGRFLIKDITLNNRKFRLIMEQPGQYKDRFVHNVSIIYQNYSLVFIQSRHRDRLYRALKRALLICMNADSWENTVWVGLDDDDGVAWNRANDIMMGHSVMTQAERDNENLQYFLRRHNYNESGKVGDEDS